jgi:hypothetical protein
LIGKMATRFRKARLKGGSGEAINFYEMSDGLAILEVTPTGVESPTPVENVIQKFFYVPEKGAMEYKPYDGSSDVLQRLRQRIGELCPSPDEERERVIEILRNSATVKVKRDKS